VPEPAQVEQATQVARGIEGVKAVDNQLRPARRSSARRRGCRGAALA
jgi:hypothetical protein